MDVDIASFLAITGDTNPIHTDHDAATLAGFSAPIIPGSLMASMFPTIIGTQYPGSIYLTQTLKFRAPATVGSLIHATVRLEKLSAGGKRAAFYTECRCGNVLLLDGQALALIP